MIDFINVCKVIIISFSPTEQTKEMSGTYVVMEARLAVLFKSEEDYDILAKFKGRQLKGVRYTPLFNYFSEVCLHHHT